MPLPHEMRKCKQRLHYTLLTTLVYRILKSTRTVSLWLRMHVSERKLLFSILGHYNATLDTFDSRQSKGGRKDFVTLRCAKSLKVKIRKRVLVL